ncbi:mucoidy inhibitor MuiA family protein [Archangium primigenium]|uniref:mucoidy inhibitor MuiA family protein n=1 Tax=[Archangium] primigenium TaxID=2792470 RepID=UPI00195A669B
MSTLWLAAVEAPVTSVTVYGDQARVVRTAKVTLSGTQRVELPRLYGQVEPDSLRVEARGAEVTRVEVRPVTSEPLPGSEARRLITELERLDDRLAQVRAEHAAHTAALAHVWRLQPQGARGSSESGEASATRSPPRLDAAGWKAAADFVAERASRLQAKVRELAQRESALEREQTALVQEARRLGGAPQQRGLEVLPTVTGQGAATLTLTYVTRGARWVPTYELRLEPESSRVEVAFAGRVSQDSGEDWEDAALTLSTALPSRITRVPEPTTWKIGQLERFIPTAPTVPDAWRAPPPPPPPSPRRPDEDERLRGRLLALSAGGASRPLAPEERLVEESLDEEEVAAGMPMPAPSVEARNYEALAELAPGANKGSFRGAPPDVGATAVGLSPPAAWRPPPVAPNSPAALAGGYALTFPAQRRETVRSGGGERRVPLLTESWPVQLQRDVYPALTPTAFLVAQLRSPSKQVLPGGEAQLFVGADPAGQAKLSVVAPGEPFTLPLGVDPAVRPVRNVRVVSKEKGFLGKKDVTDYLVTLEVANPYPVPLALVLHDQWPLSRSQDVEVELVRTEPSAEQDKDKGTLVWRLTVPPSAKTSVSFHYTVRLPKGWRLTQSP